MQEILSCYLKTFQNERQWRRYKILKQVFFYVSSFGSLHGAMKAVYMVLNFKSAKAHCMPSWNGTMLLAEKISFLHRWAQSFQDLFESKRILSEKVIYSTPLHSVQYHSHSRLTIYSAVKGIIQLKLKRLLE